MYTEQNRGFTVITNFGCDCHCKYCITKHHPILQNAVTDKNKIDWEYLEKCISESDAPTVNLSGGGDPFYDWQNNIDFYNHMYELASKYGKKLDIHTRIIPTDMDLIWKFGKIAFSIETHDSNAMKQLEIMLPEIEKATKLRVSLNNWLGGYTTMSADNEQWLTNGVCEKCRKQKYCSKPCTRNKRRTSAELRSATIQAMDAYSGGAYSSVLKALDEVSKFS